MNNADDPIAKTIADALDQALSKADSGKRMSQSALSRLSKVPQPTISRALSAFSVPEIDTIIKLCAVIGDEWILSTGLPGIGEMLGTSQKTPASLAAKEDKAPYNHPYLARDQDERDLLDTWRSRDEQQEAMFRTLMAMSAKIDKTGT
jgi:transcriptional regulator with XRE-family HTH domain